MYVWERHKCGHGVTRHCQFSELGVDLSVLFPTVCGLAWRLRFLICLRASFSGQIWQQPLTRNQFLGHVVVST
jgi:hypothetical protein